MKKILLFMLTMGLSLMIASCTNLEGKMFFRDKYERLADSRIEQVFNTIKAHDKDALISLFSKKALDETDSIERQVDELFSFIQGDLVAWSREYPSVSEETEDGKMKSQLRIWSTIKGDEQSYLIFLADYPVDEIYPDNEGLYSLGIIKSEDKNKLKGPFQKYITPGISFLDN